jgi:hypothetical protein
MRAHFVEGRLVPAFDLLAVGADVGARTQIEARSELAVDG